MRYLAVSINGILDLKNFYPLALELTKKYHFTVDIMTHMSGLENLVPIYDGLIVGTDWNENSALVLAFKNAGKKTVLLQSEGMFIDENAWYLGKSPLTDAACVWGLEHAQIFRKRGYRGNVFVSGPPRFDSYYNFKPQMSREDVYHALGLEDLSKPYLLYLGQFFPKDEFGEALFNQQIELTQFAGKTPSQYYGLIKAHPQETPERTFSRLDILGPSRQSNIRLIDSGRHTETIDISTLLYYAELSITFSSTAAVEAMLISKPAAIYCGTVESPLSNGQIATLPVISSHDQIDDIIKNSNSQSIHSFKLRFIPGAITGEYTSTAAKAIDAFSKGEVFQYPLVTRKLTAPENPVQIAESDNQIIDAAAYKTVAINGYTQAATALVQSFTNDAEVLARLNSLCDEPKSGEYKAGEYYQALHENDHGYMTNNWLVPELPFLKQAGAQKIVEIGCGNGRFLRAAAAIAHEVVGLDFAASPALVDLPSNCRFIQRNVVSEPIPSAQLICSADVLEHFRLEDVIQVVGKLHRAAPKNFHLIACYDDNHSHETIMHPGAWLALFQHYAPQYRIVDIRPRRNDANQLICVIANF